MESLMTINNISVALIALINAGGIFRLIFCIIGMMSGEPHSMMQMKKRLIHTIIFLAIANAIIGIHAMAIYYYGG